MSAGTPGDEPIRELTLFGSRFSESSTGGGCLALSAMTADGSGRSILITEGEGCGLPTARDWFLGVYDADGQAVCYPGGSTRDMLESAAALISQSWDSQVNACIASAKARGLSPCAVLCAYEEIWEPSHGITVATALVGVDEAFDVVFADADGQSVGTIHFDGPGRGFEARNSCAALEQAAAEAVRFLRIPE